MNPLQKTFLHLVPAIIINVESAALRHKHQGIDVHDRTENAGQIREECWIQRKEGKDQNTAKNSRERVGRQTDFNKVIGQLIISLRKRLVLGHDTHEFDDHAKDRHRQHKATVVEMLLVGEPEQHTTLEVISRIVPGSIYSFRSGSTNYNPLCLIIDIPTLLDLISIRLCRIASRSFFTDSQ